MALQQRRRGRRPARRHPGRVPGLGVDLRVNVPVGVAIFAPAPTLISEGRIEDADRRVDVLGAASPPASCSSSTRCRRRPALGECPDARAHRALGRARRRLLLVEARTPTPIVPLRLFRSRPVRREHRRRSSARRSSAASSCSRSTCRPSSLPRRSRPVRLPGHGGGDDPRRSDRASRHHAHGRSPVMIEPRSGLRHSLVHAQLPVDGTFWRNRSFRSCSAASAWSSSSSPCPSPRLRIEDRVAGVASGMLNTCSSSGVRSVSR